jgi:poly(3-hydroxybutyrate) depolymerase
MAGGGTAGGDASTTAEGGGIEMIDLTPTPSAGCGIDPDMTGSQATNVLGVALTIIKKGVTFTGKDGMQHQAEYILTLPPTYTKTKSFPLAFGMGGYTRDALDCLYGDCWGFTTEGHNTAIIALLTQVNPGVLHPPQTADPNNAPVKTGWELSNELQDNVTFFKAAMADIEAKYCVDTKHVFVGGGSAGGDMAMYLGCWLGDQLRGVASVGGCMPNTIAPVAGTSPQPAPARGQETPLNICLKTLDFSVCKGSVATLMVHGYKDPHIPYADARLTRDAWAVKNGCANTTMPPLDTVHTMISATVNKITCADAQTCAGDYPVRWCEHSEGGYDGSTHGWPSNAIGISGGAGKYIWDFWNSLK